jgi:hypothetical protein
MISDGAPSAGHRAGQASDGRSFRNRALSCDGPDAGAAGVWSNGRVTRETIMITWLFRISVSSGLAGMLLGMGMGITQNFLLAPVHAHFILLGFIAMFLSALYYRTVPEAAASQLAPVQAVVSVVGAILFPIGITCVRLGDRERFMPVLVAGWLTVLAGMLLFVVIVYRSSGRAPARATTL